MATPQPDTNPKTAAGRLKPNLHAIPPSALIALGLAMENGEGKYGLMNWRASPVSSSVYYDAALRHLLAWWDGEDVAPDSRIHHLAHVTACCSILIDAEVGRTLLDDRPMAGAAGALIAHLHEKRMSAALLSVLQPSPQVAEPHGDESDLWASEIEPNPLGKEPDMATELETIAAAVARSEASSEKTLALVTGLSTKIDNIRASTTDPQTRAQLLQLAVELNAESDKVDAAETAGEAELVDPVPAEAPVADPNAAPVPDPVADPAAPVPDDPQSPAA